MSCFVYLKASDNVFNNATIAGLQLIEDPDYPWTKALTLPVSDAARVMRLWDDGYAISQTGDIRPVNFIAVCGHNISPAGTMRIMAGTTSPVSWANIVGYIPWREHTAFMLFDPPIMTRHWGVQFNDASNTWGYLRVGYIMAGMLRSLPFGQEPVREWEYIEDFENTRQVTGWGRRFVKKGYRLMRARFDFRELIGGPDWEASTLRDFLKSLDGDVEPLFLIPNKEKHEGWFGYVVSNISEDRKMRTDTSFEFQEDSPGKLVESPQPFIFNAGDDITAMGGVFSRADVTSCYQINEQGTLGRRDNNVRNRHFARPTDRTVLIERAATNVLTWAEDLSQAAWIKQYITLQTGQFAPNNTQIATKVIEDVGGPHHLVAQYVPMTAGDTVVFSFYAKPGGRNWVGIFTVDRAGAGHRSYVYLPNGTVGTKDAAHTILIHAMGDGWSRVSCITNAGPGASATYVQVELANADGGTFYSGDGVSGIYFWGFQVENSPVVTNPAANRDASSLMTSFGVAVGRPADQLRFPFPGGFHGIFTVYVSFIERSPDIHYRSGILYIGRLSASPGSFYGVPCIWIDKLPNMLYRGVYIPSGTVGSGEPVHTAFPQPAINDLVELRLTMNEGGQVVLYQTINAGTEIGTPSGAVVGLTSWAPDTWVIFGGGHAPWDIETIGSVAIKSVKIVRGGRSLAEMRAW